MKKILLTFVALMSMLTIQAAQSYELQLVLSDSTKLTYPITQSQPKITFLGGQFTINGENYEFSNISYFKVAAVEATGIEGVKESLRSDKPADVYTIDGKLIARGVKDLNTSSLPAGTYIIRTGGSSMKWIKK